MKSIVIAEPFKTSNYYEMLSRAIPEFSSSNPGELKSEVAPSLATVISIHRDKLK